MKYDLLIPFKKQLLCDGSIAPNTAKTYYSAVEKIFRDQQFGSFQDIDPKFIENVLPGMFKTKNEFSAAKNGLLRLHKMYPDLIIPDENFFSDASSRKRNFSKRPKKTIDLDRVKRCVNQMSDKKLKLAYRLAMVSGLRVSEISALNASDLLFNDGVIQVSVKHGKGGSNGLVTCLDDQYLYRELLRYIESLIEGNERLFYSDSHMRREAGRLNLECHDFRRIFAITLRNQLKAEGKDLKETDKTVQEQLRHKRFSTTKRYLYNRKLIIKSGRKK